MPDARPEGAHLAPVRFDGARPVDGYGPGFTRVGGEVFWGAILCLAEEVRPWGGWDDPAALTALGSSLDVLFLGTGAGMAPLPPAFRAALEAAGVPVEPMATPAACRTYNVLLSEGRRVGAALIPV